MGRVTRGIGTAVLVLLSILLAYGLLEVGMHLTVTRWPAWMFNSQCRELRTLGQTSKNGVLPRSPYIAILGDSYGSGQGDWFAENGYNLNSRYQAAHVLQDLTGTDVISLSRAGAGNYDGPAIFAINTFKLLQRLGFALPAPAAVVVYFYEGNDMSDNLRMRDRYYTPTYDSSGIFDDKSFEVFASDIDKRFCQGGFRLPQDYFFAGNLLSRTIEGMIYSATKSAKPLPSGQSYSAIIDGRSIPLPDNIAEDDLVHMTPESKAVGVRFLERSLSRVARFWPQARRYVVYIPAALATYQVAEPEGEAIRMASADMELRVQQAAAQNGFEYLSAVPVLREKAAKTILHGPKDWHHLNRQGYTALGAFLATKIHTQ